MDKKKQSLASRLGTYAVGLSVLVVAIVVVLNLAVAQLPDSVLQFDISDNRLYSLTDTSKDFLATLDKDVRLVVLADPENIDGRITRFLSNYDAESDRVSLEYIDPVLYPSALETYEAAENDIVVLCEETDKQSTVAISEMIEIDLNYFYQYGQIYETSFDGEGLITSAVDLVTSETVYTLYTLTGHGESELPAVVTDAIAKQNLGLNSVSLLMEGSIPDDCSLIISYMPTMDFDTQEREMLEEYIAGGGKVMILCDRTDLENVNALLASYGLSYVDGYIADPNRYYQTNMYNIFPMLATGHKIIEPLPADSLALVANSRGLQTLDDRRDSLNVQYFMYTSENAFAVLENGEMTEGRYLLAATSTESDENGGGRLTVIACPTLIDEYLLTNFSNLVNLNIFMNAITDNFEDISTISVPAKSLETVYNTIASAPMLSVLFIAVIPLACLVFGLVFWLKRRKL